MKSPDGQRECSAFHKHKRISLSGKRTTTVCLLNPSGKEVEQIEVDGCAITDGLRCDWLVRVIGDATRKEVFIELKSSDVSRAIEQLRASIIQLSEQKSTHPKNAIIVFSRNPMDGTDVQNQKVKFLKEFNAAFKMVRDNSEMPL